EGKCASHLSGLQPSAGPSRLPAVSSSLAVGLPRNGPATGEGSSRTTFFFPLSPAPVAQAAHHQCHCRGSPPTHASDGVLCQRRQRGSDHLLDLPPIHPGLEKPHPPPFYTSSLTSPPPGPALLTCSILGSTLLVT